MRCEAQTSPVLASTSASTASTASYAAASVVAASAGVVLATRPGAKFSKTTVTALKARLGDWAGPYDTQIYTDDVLQCFAMFCNVLHSTMLMLIIVDLCCMRCCLICGIYVESWSMLCDKVACSLNIIFTSNVVCCGDCAVMCCLSK